MDVNNCVLRPSVVEIEPSKKQRHRAIKSFLGLSVLMAFLTPLYLLQTLGVLPPTPSTDGISTAIYEYDQFINDTSTMLYQEIYSAYLNSTNSQTQECSELSEFAYAQQLQLQTELFNLEQGYCPKLSQRLFEFASENFPDFSPVNSTCSDVLLEPKEHFLTWYVNQSDLVSCTTSVYLGNSSTPLCPMQYLPQNTSSCPDDYAFDYYGTSTQHLSCNWFVSLHITSKIRSISDFAFGGQDVRFALANYNQQFVLNARQTMQQLSAVSAGMSESAGSLRESGEEHQRQLKENQEYIDSVRQKINTLAKAFPGLISSVDASHLDKGFNNEVFDTLDNERKAFNAYIDGLEDYNPPPISSASTPSATLVILEPKVPDMNLLGSQLAEALAALLDSFLSMIALLTTFDLLLRMCYVLQDISIILREPRRDLSSTASKGQGVLSLVMEKSHLIVYSSVGILLIYLLSQAGLSLAFFARDVQANCQNQLLARNARALEEFRTTVLKDKDDCNNVLLQENRRIETYNLEIVDDLQESMIQYQAWYQAHPDSTHMFALPTESIALSPKVFSEYQTTTIIELYQLDVKSICKDSEEAHNVSEESEKLAKALTKYFVFVMVMGMVLLCGLRCLSYALQLYYWMELSKGYIFDKEFKSEKVLAKRRPKRRAGLILGAIVFMGFALTFYMLI